MDEAFLHERLVTIYYLVTIHLIQRYQSLLLNFTMQDEIKVSDVTI
jgi:hypothetical protein